MATRSRLAGRGEEFRRKNGMQMSGRALTLSKVVVPAQGVVRDALLVFGFSLFIALSAYVRIPLPWSTVPLTGQTLAVLLTGAVLGSRLGSLSMLAYLAEGLAGLPVFAGGSSAWTVGSTGVPTIVGSSAGYLYSYPVAAFVVGYLAERGWDRSFFRAALAMLAGEAVIYAIALPWLALSIAVNPLVAVRFAASGSNLLSQTIFGGFIIFVPGDLIKLFAAAAALPGAWAVAGRRGKTTEK